MPTEAELAEKPKTIRLACQLCDTQEADGVSEIPAGWDEVWAFSDKELASRDVGEWWTHLGYCPECSVLPESERM